MNIESYNKANEIMAEIKTLETEIKSLSGIEKNTRENKMCTHRLGLKKLLKIPTKKTVYNYWSSQDLDSIHSIVLFDADEIKCLVDFKLAKVSRLKEELQQL